MSSAKLLARHMSTVHFGGNWTVSNLKDQLSDVDFRQATSQFHSFNTIATLAFHINYFIKVVIKVLDGGPLEGKDAESFAHPFKSQEDWQYFKEEMWRDAQKLSSQIETLSEEELQADFVDKKYGDLYRQLLGIIEHSHYHLGQISLIKKLVQAEDKVA